MFVLIIKNQSARAALARIYMCLLNAFSPLFMQDLARGIPVSSVINLTLNSSEWEFIPDPGSGRLYLAL